MRSNIVMSLPRHFLWAILGLCLNAAGCQPVDEFKAINGDVAGPTAVASSADGNYFYVLNSDFEWLYKTGSILVLKESGQKVAATQTPRLGRSLEVEGQRMMATFDRQNGEPNASVVYYDLTDPANPTPKMTWQIECSPISTVFRPQYEYFFVACINGDLYLGSFSDLSIRRVRSYGTTRKAMFIDEVNQRLIAFPTVLRNQNSAQDKINAVDIKTYTPDPDSVESEAPNEVPDDFENTKRQRRILNSSYRYQFIVYDIGAEKALEFPYRYINSVGDDTALWESRYIYFSLTDADGTPDSVDDVRSRDYKDYRTNFWAAQPDPDNPDSFYVSHRGQSGSANNVIRVTIIGDLKTKPANSGVCDPGFRFQRNACIPFTEKVMTFERVYGYNGEVDYLHYPGDFLIKTIKGQETLLVNHFRDLVYWNADRRRFSVASKVLGDNKSLKEISSTDHMDSFFAIAANSRGKAVSLAFYGHAIFLMDVVPGVSISIDKRINSGTGFE